ncbi:MucR family transcriptional regulator [Methylobacterium iners]|uniref:MucR family transcriptional regulator n=1 Tax=Methylobacterium iners TaxID=418707 RepID=A0ABQ4S4X8_9HYPH|nr:MucR family transcriptional regulator [Methylobacterium iners]GJD97630.1 hypothetical protein OCOJLMKI_4863 [Methylobacterium iners]
MSDETERGQFMGLTVEVVSAYLRNNHVRADTLGDLIGSVHRTLVDLKTVQGSEVALLPQIKATAQDIKRSITPEYLVSFEDGRRYKALKRHLTARGLTPEAYRLKWGLPVDYLMIARASSDQRSQGAILRGLAGHARHAQSAKAPAGNERLTEEPNEAPSSEPSIPADSAALAFEDADEEAVELVREPFEDDGLPDET